MSKLKPTREPGQRRLRCEVVDGIASFDMRYRLSDLQGLSKKAAIEVIVHTLKVLIESSR